MVEDNQNTEKEVKKDVENEGLGDNKVENAKASPVKEEGESIESKEKTEELSDEIVEDGEEASENTDDKKEPEVGKSIVKHSVPPPPPPPPPHAPKAKSRFLSSKVNSEKSVKLDDGKAKGKYDKNFAADLNLPPKILETKSIAGIVVGVMVLGAVLGAVFAGGGSCPPCSDINFGVVRNPEIVRTVKRCGIAEVWEQCRLLIPNPNREEQKARDLYQRASTLSGVPLYKIDSVNIRYANEIIKPGYIAEIKIPPRDI